MKKYILECVMIFLGGMTILGTSWKAKEKATPTLHLTNGVTSDSLYGNFIDSIYNGAHLEEAGLSEQVFEKAITGFYNLKYSGLLQSKSILTIADFDQESRKKRLYIIDLEQQKLLLNTWVAHGQNSGGDKPTVFSNIPNSNQSSIGFYLTGEVYYGKHGRSLRLDGMDPGFNNNARQRAIVLHGADYVCQQSIDQLGRLGRSQGCPAVPSHLSNQIINTIAGKTVLYINYSDQTYQSVFLNEALAAQMALNQNHLYAAQLN